MIGASLNPQRYSNMAVRRLKENGKKVMALGIRPGEIDGVNILVDLPELDNIDTISLYLNPLRQKAYYDYILKLNPRRIIFNPGTENIELVKLAKEKGIETEFSCMLVMLSTGIY